jgi:hypothetical protein
MKKTCLIANGLFEDLYFLITHECVLQHQNNFRFFVRKINKRIALSFFDATSESKKLKTMTIESLTYKNLEHLVKTFKVNKKK